MVQLVDINKHFFLRWDRAQYWTNFSTNGLWWTLQCLKAARPEENSDADTQSSTACHMGGKKVGGGGDHNTQQISHAQLQAPPPSLPVET